MKHFVIYTGTKNIQYWNDNMEETKKMVSSHIGNREIVLIDITKYNDFLQNKHAIKAVYNENLEYVTKSAMFGYSLSSIEKEYLKID
jgi:hypothetical protein